MRAAVETIGSDAAAVRVSATPGAVTLDGFVASEAERRAVLDAAGTAAPERRVVDALTVRR